METFSVEIEKKNAFCLLKLDANRALGELINIKGLKSNETNHPNFALLNLYFVEACDIHMEVRNRPVSSELWFKERYCLGFLGCHKCPIVPWDTAIH